MRSDESDESATAPTAKTSPWRVPSVVAAIAVALITGVFGTVQVIIPYVVSMRNPEAPTSATVDFTFSTDSIPALMQDVRRALTERPAEVPIEARMRAISALAGVAETGATPAFFSEAARILVKYLEEIADNRRHVVDDFSTPYGPDRTVTRPHDVIEALIALDVLRDAAPAPLPVKIGSIDFSFMDLSRLDLSGFDAGHGTFRNAFLSACDCRDAIFDHADLRGAVIWSSQTSQFQNTTFVNANVQGSKWANVDLTGSNLSGVRGIPEVWVSILPREMQALFR